MIFEDELMFKEIRDSRKHTLSAELAQILIDFTSSVSSKIERLAQGKPINVDGISEALMNRDIRFQFASFNGTGFSHATLNQIKSPRVKGPSLLALKAPNPEDTGRSSVLIVQVVMENGIGLVQIKVF